MIQQEHKELKEAEKNLDKIQKDFASDAKDFAKKQLGKMTPQKKLEAVKKEIYKACPELKELEFGCKIKDSRGDLIIVGESYDGYYITDWGGMIGSSTTIKKEDIVEIIGQDIGLEDVLRALCEKDIGFLVDSMGECFLETDGDIEPIWITENGTDSRLIWELGSTLDNQSPEVWEFLYRLIVEK